MQNEMQPPPSQPPRTRQFWFGIGLGAIPLVLGLIAIGALSSSIGGELLIISLVLYVVLFIAAIVCLIIRDVRYVGYGLLTMVCATPIIVAVACTVRFMAPTPYP